MPEFKSDGIPEQAESFAFCIRDQASGAVLADIGLSDPSKLFLVADPGGLQFRSKPSSSAGKEFED
jgi:hypothetical protein